jgi:hypothetical protein
MYVSAKYLDLSERRHGRLEKLEYKGLHKLSSSPKMIRMIRYRRMVWALHVTLLEVNRNAQTKNNRDKKARIKETKIISKQKIIKCFVGGIIMKVSILLTTGSDELLKESSF